MASHKTFSIIFKVRWEPGYVTQTFVWMIALPRAVMYLQVLLPGLNAMTPLSLVLHPILFPSMTNFVIYHPLKPQIRQENENRTSDNQTEVMFKSLRLFKVLARDIVAVGYKLTNYEVKFQTSTKNGACSIWSGAKGNKRNPGMEPPNLKVIISQPHIAPLKLITDILGWTFGVTNGCVLISYWAQIWFGGFMFELHADGYLTYFCLSVSAMFANWCLCKNPDKTRTSRNGSISVCWSLLTFRIVADVMQWIAYSSLGTQYALLDLTTSSCEVSFDLEDLARPHLNLSPSVQAAVGHAGIRDGESGKLRAVD